jgi:hypothetical protein
MRGMGAYIGVITDTLQTARAVLRLEMPQIEITPHISRLCNIFIFTSSYCVQRPGISCLLEVEVGGCALPILTLSLPRAFD